MKATFAVAQHPQDAASLLKQWNFPLYLGMTSDRTLEGLRWLVDIGSARPDYPSCEDRASLHRSAHERINQGCVMFVSAFNDNGQHFLEVIIHSGMKKTTSYRVFTKILPNGLDVPECQCVNNAAKEAKSYCVHMLMVFLLVERLQHGFERVEYSSKARDWTDPSRVAPYYHVQDVFELHEARRIVLQLARHEHSLNPKLVYLTNCGVELRSFQNSCFCSSRFCLSSWVRITMLKRVSKSD